MSEQKNIPARSTSVIIVGAGPTGLALACQLIRYGIDFIIIDTKENTTPYSRAIGVQARTLEIYEQIGLADKLVNIGAKAEFAKMFAAGKMRGHIDFRGFGKGLSAYPYVLIAEQGKHEKILYDFIRADGRDVEWRTELSSFTQSDSIVTCEIDREGTREIIEGEYLIACDGAKSAVRHSLGLTFDGSTMARMFYVADVEIEWKFGSGGLFVFLMKNNLLAVFTMDGEKRFRIVGTFPEEFSKDEGDVLYEEIEAQLRRDAEIEFDITKVNWFSTYKVHTRHVNKFSEGRCFLAGDAAHIHTPAGGQGMNTGIQDGYNLAWKLAYVLKGEANPDILQTYNEERLPNAVNLTQTTDRFFNLVASPKWWMVFVRLYIFPYVANVLFSFNSVKRFAFPRISQIDINYRGGSLAEDHGSFDVKAGDRMPWFEVNGKSVYDDLHEPQFHLLVFSDGITAIPPLSDEMMKRWHGSIDSHFYTLNDRAAEIFGTTKPFFVILRPDNYIGMISDEFAHAVVESYLKKIF